MSAGPAARTDGWWGGFVASFARQGRWLRANPWDFALLSWLPLLAAALLLWTFSAGVPRELPIVVVDQDHTAASRQLIRYLDASPGLRLADQVVQWDEAQSLLRQRRAFGVVWIPRDFERDLVRGLGTSVQWFYNGQYQTHVGGMNRDVRAVVSTYSAGAALAARSRKGTPMLQAEAQIQPIRLQMVAVYNENTSYEPFLALSLMPAILQIFVALATVTLIGRELKNGTVPAWLAAANGRWSAALAGALAWPALAFGLQGLLIVAWFGARGWPIEGSIAAVLLGLALLITSMMGFGVLFVGLTLSLRMAISVAGLVAAPAFAFSGQGFPLVAMPPLALTWAQLLPLTHYLQIQSRHWLGGAPLHYGLTELAILVLATVVTLVPGYCLLRGRANAPAAWGKS
ncbi:MAG: ABC transporter permease [Burkholderiaceae bacterium]